MTVKVNMEDLETQDGGTERKPVVHFAGIDKPLVCNVTNWDSIEELHGADTDGWVGRSVVIYVDPDVRFGSKRTGGIRIKAAPPSTEDGTVGDDGSTPF